MRMYDASQITTARENVAQYETARAVADGVMKEADRWVGREASFIAERMPDGRVPRALAVNFVTGCPLHGPATAVCEGMGLGNWSVDVFDEPWKVRCAAGGEVYPSHDFGAFYRSGMTDRSLLTGEYPDDGHGWLSEGARHRHWFVGYACTAMWAASINGLEALAQAWALSGEEWYAQQALVMLRRAADVYGGMDYRNGMYATEFSPGYSGKIGYQIGETRVVYRLACAFDLVRDAATAAACKHIETGLAREMMRGVYEEHTRGNYGMHQVALMASALVLGDADELAGAVEWTLNQSGEASRLKEMRMLVDGYVFRDRAAHAEGLKWAWDNLMFREGIGWESSPSYSGGWVETLFGLAALMERAGQPIWDAPKLRRMLVWPVEMSHFGLSTPAIGDAGGVETFAQRISGRVLRLAFEKYRDPLAAQQMLERGLFGGGSFEQFGDLMRPGADEGALRAVAAGKGIGRVRDQSRLMGGYGLAMLRAGQGEDGVAASVYYGRAATEHGHFDRLNLELFGYGRRLLPELGYPIHAAEGPEPGMWTKNTSAHATVMVDERRQSNQSAGRVCAFVTGARTQYVEIDAAGTYDQTSEYRRAVVMATVGGAGGEAQQHYVIDLFRMTGGKRHDYSLHGFDAPFSVAGLDLSEAGQGTLAGEDVAYGSAYDDADLDRPDCVRSYYTYAGSGYSYLRNVRRGRPVGVWSATWDDGEAGVRVHGLPDEGGEVMLADAAYPEKQAERHYLKFVIQRRDGDPASSCFASVIEPYRGEPFIGRVTDASTEGVRRICVEHSCGSDTWTLNPGVDGARVVRVARDGSGQMVGVDVIGRGQVQEAECAVRVTGGVTGRITRVDDGAHEIEVALEGEGVSDECVKSMAGQTAIIGNPRHGTTYTVVEALRERGKLIVRFGDESFRIGRLKVGPVSGDGGTIVTPTYLYLAQQGYYRGTHLVNEAGDAWHELEDVVLSPHRPGCRRDGRVTLREPGGGDLARRLGTEASIYDLGPGDRFEIVPHVHVERGDDGEWVAEGFGQYDVGYDWITSVAVRCGASILTRRNLAMQYTHLGRTGLKVSRLCLGTMNFGAHTSEADSHAIMDQALALDVQFFDTADIYGWTPGEGVTEQIVGRWIAQGGGRRERIVLATKVYNDMSKEGQPDPNLARGLSARKIIACCEGSLRRLQTDCIDLYQMHHIDRECPFDEIWEAMETLVRQGKVIYVGSSNFAGWDIAHACGEAARRHFQGLVCEQSIYHLDNRMVELEVLPSCRHFGLGFIPWSPLGGGMLGGVLNKPKEGRRGAERMADQIEAKRAQLEPYEKLCADLGEAPANVALAWLLSNPVVTAPIIGPRTAAQLKDAQRAVEIELSAETLAKLDEIWPGPGGEAPKAYAW